MYRPTAGHGEFKRPLVNFPFYAERKNDILIHIVSISILNLGWLYMADVHPGFVPGRNEPSCILRVRVYPSDGLQFLPESRSTPYFPPGEIGSIYYVVAPLQASRMRCLLLRLWLAVLMARGEILSYRLAVRPGCPCRRLTDLYGSLGRAGPFC